MVQTMVYMTQNDDEKNKLIPTTVFPYWVPQTQSLFTQTFIHKKINTISRHIGYIPNPNSIPVDQC